jgi:hypothetical protein
MKPIRFRRRKMNYYLIAKLLHILGALGFFMAIGLEVLSLWQARNATTSVQVRERLHISNSAQRLGPLSMLLILISGFSMMAIARIGSAWLIVAFGALGLMVVLGLALTAPRMAAIRRALTAENGPVSASLHNLLHNSLLSLSIHMRVTMALGIVVLMTLKPDLLGALITTGVAVILGLASSLPVRGRDQEKVQA